jgi:hypothetical protein
VRSVGTYCLPANNESIIRELRTMFRPSGHRLWLAICLFFFSLPFQSAAEVNRIEITHREPLQGGKSFGPVGPYEKIVGRIYFGVDPNNPANKRIADISLAPRNSQGLVEFSADFVMLRPLDPSKARHTVLLEIPNRGLTQANGSFFTISKATPFKLPELKDVSFDDAFVLEQGFTLIWTGWQFDLPADSIRVQVPSAHTHGPVRAAIIPNHKEMDSKTYALSKPSFYCAADTVQTDATLTLKIRFDEKGQLLSRTTWAFAREENGKLVPDPCSLYLAQGFQEGKLYEFVYQGTEPPVAGLGLAAIRDFVSYLKNGRTGGPLREHPETLQHVLGYGYSQSARFLREFLYKGFNADEHGRQAFDGLFIASAGAGRGSFDHRYAMPGDAGNSVLSYVRPVDLFPFSDGLEDDPVEHLRDGLLSAAQQTHTLPKIFYTYSSTEYWARVGSLAYTSVDGEKELSLDSNARLYFFAGTPHARAPFPPAKERKSSSTTYAYLSNFATPGWSFRALLLDLDDWVSKDSAPPASAYPHLPNELVRLDRINFPKIPSVEFPTYMPSSWRVDYGPDFPIRGLIRNEPPTIGPPYQVLVPQSDQDGNDQGGILVPEVAVPLGTFTGWNYELPRLPNFNYLAGLTGSFFPFPRTREERLGDSRLSIEERYKTREDYLSHVRVAAESLIARRLLRTEDLKAILQKSGEQWDYLTRKNSAN